MLVLALIAAIGPIAGTAVAQVQTAPSRAALSVVGDANPKARVTNADGGKQRAALRVAVLNSGDVPANLSFTAFLGNAARGRTCGARSVDVVPAQQYVAAPNEATVADLTLVMDHGCIGSAGTLVVHGDPGVDPTTTAFTLQRHFDGLELWLAGFAALFGFVLAGAVLVLLLSLDDGQGSKRFRWVTDPIMAGPTWSFRDSWLTSITGIGALVTSILAASGFLDEVLPGTSTARLVGLSLLAAGFVVFAPIISTAFSSWTPIDGGDGKTKLVSVATGGGLVFAVAVVVAGVYMQLTIIGIMVDAADLAEGGKYALLSVIFAAAVIVMLYAVRSTLGAVEERHSASEKYVTSGGVAL